MKTLFAFANSKGGTVQLGKDNHGHILALENPKKLLESLPGKIIQKDVSVNPGNSGGALVNKKGKLVGVVKSKVTGADGNYNVGRKAFKESVNKNYEKYYSILENYDPPKIIGGSDQAVTFSKYKELFVERATQDTSIVVESTWIAVWQKQDDDSWKIVMTTWQP